MPRPRSAEFALLLACCRWPLAPQDVAALVERIDWNRILRLAERHRVEGMVWTALVAAGVAPPEPVRAALSAAAGRIARQNLLLAGESIQLERLLKQAGAAPLFVKGVTLGKLVYGDIARKAGWDIDLLVAPEELAAAIAVLEARGYASTIPATGEPGRDLPDWHRRSKESVWRSANGTIWVELHTALTDNPLLLSGIGTASPRRQVEVSPGLFLPTLERDELFAYLCVHGASSAWFRLKWIADLAALIGTEPPEEIERLYRRSLVLGAGRASAQALLLADELFGIAMPTALRDELRADRAGRWLAAAALRKLIGRTGEVELDRVTLGTASIHLTQLWLMPGWRFKRAELVRQLRSMRLAMP